MASQVKLRWPWVIGAVATGGGAAHFESIGAVLTAVTWLAATAGLFQTFNTPFRVYAGHWSSAHGLRRLLAGEIFYGAVAMYAIAFLAASVGEQWWSAVIVFALAGLTWQLHLSLEVQIRRRIDGNPDLQQGTSLLADLAPFRVLTGNPDTLGEIADRGEWLPHRVLRRVFAAPRNGLSPVRFAIAYVLSVVTFATGAAAFTGAAGEVVGTPFGGSRSPEPTATVTATPEPSASPGVGGTPPDRPQRQWLDVCNGQLPGAGADAASRAALMRLYLGLPSPVPGAEPPPGADDGGCDGPLEIWRGRTGGPLKFTVGVSADGQTELSIAVLSPSYGPSLFLAPAIDPVRALIRRYGDLGGTARVDVGFGDAYAVSTPSGTAVLLRASKTLANSSDAAPYFTLLPAAAKEWVRLSMRRGRLLLPVGEAPPDGVGELSFAAADSTTPLHRMRVDEEGRVTVDGQPGPTGAVGTAIGPEVIRVLRGLSTVQP